MDPLDVYGILHAPARLACRLLLAAKYLFRGVRPSERWPDEYARNRYGPNYRHRPWLLFDLEELERVENMINTADDKYMLTFRDAQLDVTKLVAVVVSQVL